jgi:hypothetical protein
MNRARPGWLYLTAVLLVLYVCQIVPHDHSESGHPDHHSEHHDAPIPQGHHSHPQDIDTNDETSQPWSAHHHDLAQHVDSHFLRTPSHELKINPDFFSQVAQLRPISEDEPIRARWSDVETWVPDTIPIFPLDSRAPPVRG